MLPGNRRFHFDQAGGDRIARFGDWGRIKASSHLSAFDTNRDRPRYAMRFETWTATPVSVVRGRPWRNGYLCSSRRNMSRATDPQTGLAPILNATSKSMIEIINGRQ